MGLAKRNDVQSTASREVMCESTFDRIIFEPTNINEELGYIMCSLYNTFECIPKSILAS